ncbi:MAG: hypothetical protein M1828_005990 [Chrysothrix sp. TS-e1954]|nr:MAG: hypothetical protein M1828_005990 [Chrysothrix sp. TS-e1954]
MGVVYTDSGSRRKKDDIGEFVEEDERSSVGSEDDPYEGTEDESDGASSSSSSSEESVEPEEEDEEEDEEAQAARELEAIQEDWEAGLTIAENTVFPVDPTAARLKRDRIKAVYCELETEELDNLAVKEEEIAEFNSTQNPRKPRKPRTPNTMPAITSQYRAHDEDPYDEEVERDYGPRKPASLPRKVPARPIGRPRRKTANQTVKKGRVEKPKQQRRVTKAKAPEPAIKDEKLTVKHKTVHTAGWDDVFAQAQLLANVSNRNDWNCVTISLKQLVDNSAARQRFSIQELIERTNEAFVLFHKRIHANAGIVHDKAVLQELRNLQVPDTDANRKEMFEALRRADKTLLQRLVTPLIRES